MSGNGIPYSLPRAADQVSAAQLAERAEPGLCLGIVPEGVRFITAFVDVQGNRFEILYRGWGVQSESWVIAAETIPAETATSAEAWDDLMQRLLAAAFPLADNSGRVMRVRGAGFDAYGAPGTTLHAYAAWRRWRTLGRLGLRARIDGREAWNIIPTKGLGGPNAPPLVTVRPDTQRRDRFAAAGGTVPIAQFNANTFKDHLASQLATAHGPYRGSPHDLLKIVRQAENRWCSGYSTNGRLRTEARPHGFPPIFAFKTLFQNRDQRQSAYERALYQPAGRLTHRVPPQG